MNPSDNSSNGTPGLPPVDGGQLGPAMPPQTALNPMLPVNPAMPIAGGPAQTPVVPAISSLSTPLGQAGQSLPPGLSTSSSDRSAAIKPPGQGPNPTSAEDLDLIEKEWVDRAKKIVTENRNDPYSQNKQINIVKADYMKKRYNKDVKLAD